MPDIRMVTQSVLQSTQMDQVQDAQQRQVTVNQRSAGQQFASKVDQRNSRVNQVDRVEISSLADFEGGNEGASPDAEQDPGEDKQSPAPPPPAEPGRGEQVDLKA